MKPQDRTGSPRCFTSRTEYPTEFWLLTDVFLLINFSNFSEIDKWWVVVLIEKQSTKPYAYFLRTTDVWSF